MKTITRIAKLLVEEAYNLQRKKATEILTFIMSDTNRIHDSEKPNQIPIAYALKGFSLSTEKLREMIEEVHIKCKEVGITIIADCLDDQWQKLAVQSKT